jgi:hypothetical protein
MVEFRSMRVVARKELTVASYQRCNRSLQAGEVKRVMQRGPLVGYYIGCPACGFSASYLDEVVGFLEEPAKTIVLPVGAPRKLVKIERPPSCFRCRRRIRVEGDFIEAVDDVA